MLIQQCLVCQGIAAAYVCNAFVKGKLGYLTDEGNTKWLPEGLPGPEVEAPYRYEFCAGT